jgi:membrane protease YdiL (CAAX protease family)
MAAPLADTAAFEAFVAPARRRRGLWRPVLGAGLTAVVWLAATVALAVAEPWLGPRGFLLGFLGTFLGMILGLVLALRLLHGRGLASLVGPGGFRPRAFATGVAVIAVFVLVTAAPGLIASPPERNQTLGTWLPWALPALLGLLVQTGAEELAFRGYLMQEIAARVRARILWLGVPALLFGLLHWNPAEYGPNAGLAVAVATLTGLVLGDVTARTGNLSAAMGLHFANNGVALLLLAPPSPLGALGLWTLTLDPADTGAMRVSLLANMAATVLAWGLWRLIRAGLRRRGRSLHSDNPGSI